MLKIGHARLGDFEKLFTICNIATFAWKACIYMRLHMFIYIISCRDMGLERWMAEYALITYIARNDTKLNIYMV